MSTVLTFDSREINAKDRYHSFQTFVGRLFSRLEISPLRGRYSLESDTSFSASVSAGDFAGFAIARISNTALRVCRAEQRAAGHNPERQFLLKLQVAGTGIFSQRGRCAHLRPGDFVLCDDMQPYELLCLGDSSQIVVAIPESTLRAHVDDADAWIGLHMSGDIPVNARTAQHIVAIADAANWQLPSAGDRRMKLLNSLSVALSAEALDPCGESSEALRTFLKIKKYIDHNLNDPELNPESIASAYHITPRYVHMLFKQIGISVSAYIRGQRLSRCSHEVASSPGVSITDIAFSWGFNDGAHFSRLFKIYYGLSPQRYRELIRDGVPLRLSA